MPCFLAILCFDALKPCGCQRIVTNRRGPQRLQEVLILQGFLTDLRRGVNSREWGRKRRLAPRAGFAHVDFIDEVSLEPVFTSVLTSKIRNCPNEGGHCASFVPAQAAKLDPNPHRGVGVIVRCIFRRA